jgi:hypothetical protein
MLELPSRCRKNPGLGHAGLILIALAIGAIAALTYWLAAVPRTK